MFRWPRTVAMPIFLAAAAAALVGCVAGEHPGTIAPLSDPSICFFNDNAVPGVVFKYVFTGPPTATDYVTSTLYQEDCHSSADAAGLIATTSTLDPIFVVRLDTDQVRKTYAGWRGGGSQQKF